MIPDSIQARCYYLTWERTALSWSLVSACSPEWPAKTQPSLVQNATDLLTSAVLKRQLPPWAPCWARPWSPLPKISRAPPLLLSFAVQIPVWTWMRIALVFLQTDYVIKQVSSVVAERSSHSPFPSYPSSFSHISSKLSSQFLLEWCLALRSI